MTTKRFSGALLFILLLCLFLRFVLFIVEQPWQQSVVENILFVSDSGGYHYLAVTMLSAHRFSQTADSPPETLRTPVYPLFIAFFYFLFGIKPWVIIFWQILLDTVSCFLLFLVVQKLIKKAARFAALFYAIDPFLILYCNQYLSEPLFIFLMLLGTDMLLRFMLDRGRIHHVIFSAIFFALAALTRPIAVYLPLLAVILFFFILRRHLKKAAAGSVVFAAIFMCVLLPWLMRNHHYFGRFSLSTSMSLNMLVLQVAPITMEQQQCTLNDAQLVLLRDADAWMIKDGKNPALLSDFQKAEYWQRLALHMIRQQPLIFSKYYLYGLVQNFWGLGTALFAQVLHFSETGASFDPRTCSNPIEVITQWILRKTLLQKYLGFLVAIYLTITYVLALLGLKSVWNNAECGKYAPILGIILYFIILTGSAVSVRFKLPIIPFYYVFTAIGLSVCMQYFKARFRRRGGLQSVH